MKKPSKGKAIGISGIGMIIVGVVIVLTWAVDPLLKADKWQQNPTCSDLLICTPPKPILLTGTDPKGHVISSMFGTMTFSSRGQFALNKPIFYEIKLVADHPEFIKQTYFVISTKNENLTASLNEDRDKFFQDMKHDQRLINMIKISDNEFYRQGFWTTDMPIEHVFVMLVVSPNDKVSIAGISDVLFEIVSPEVKAQDDANIEARVTNMRLLGLTWMGIGLGFALLGADFLVRVVLRETD